MKINLVLPHQLPFPPTGGGGVENLNWMLAREFARRGHEVVAYSRRLPHLPAQATDEHGIRHVRISGYDLRPNRWVDHFYGWLYSRRLARILEPADVTTFHTPFSFRIGKKSPHLGVCTHTLHRTPKWPLPFYRGLDRVYGGSDAVIAQARGVDPKIRNLKRIYNCIALPPAPPPMTATATTTKTSAPGGLRFLYVGRFVPDKGIAALVQGFASSLRAFPENRLETLGPQKSEQGADTHFFRSMVRFLDKQHLHGRVTFHPPEFDRARLNASMAAADVICVPSLGGETFSMAILEAMALGKPVLVSDFSPMPEAVEHEVTGYVARAGDPDHLAEGIEFFSRNREQLPAMGRAGFLKAQRSFSVEKIAGEYLEDFAQLIADRKSGHGARRPAASARAAGISAGCL